MGRGHGINPGPRKGIFCSSRVFPVDKAGSLKVSQGNQHQVVNGLIGPPGGPFIEERIPVLVFQFLVDKSTLKARQVIDGGLGRGVRVLRVFELDKPVMVGKFNDEIHRPHTMAQTVAGIVKLPRGHGVIDDDLQVALGQNRHRFIPPKERSISRS